MINFKNHDSSIHFFLLKLKKNLMVSNGMEQSGFSIIEIVISIAIIGTTLMALFGSQSASIRSVARGHQAVIRLYMIKNQITQHGMQPPSDEPTKTIEGQIPKPKTSLKYMVKNIPFESVLAPLKNLYLVQASGSWYTFSKEYTEQFLSLLFAPKREKK